jgi:hypothetical protein
MMDQGERADFVGRQYLHKLSKYLNDRSERRSI